MSKTTTKYAISDIHGAHQTFQAALEIMNLTKEDELYLLGDYIDRGPDSKGVIDTIWQLQADGYQVHCLKGNHEEMVADQYYDPYSKYSYKDPQLMASFGVYGLREIPRNYIDWMRALPHYIEVDDYILVHAGLNGLIDDPLRDTDSMLWIRDSRSTLNHQWLDGRIVVHGHTPIARYGIQHYLQHLDQVPDLNIDNGCVFGRRSDQLGSLCVLDLTNRDVVFVKCLD
ncbi:MAG: metallophosphoesterase family protein [Bacteroidota bacterium]